MKPKILVVSLICLVMAATVFWWAGTRKVYDREVKIVSTEFDGSRLKIAYRPTVTSIYWCRGADVTEDATAIQVAFIRGTRGNDPAVEVKRQTDPVSNEDYIEIANPQGKPVYLLPDGDDIWRKDFRKASQPH